ncbi:MAG: chemotaxis protein CheX [Symbiobacterium thermophilum]|uniref:Chemotaxis protein CheX n=2 Tax=Symbiobacterium thermophilum TaxID=2734 RepID=A0A953I396_SYMTR|nr:chemotaxis protein CheX [Symbiobacterium thermophilum]
MYAETEVRAMKLEVINAFLTAARHSLSQELQSEIKRTGLFVDPSENAIDEVAVYLSFVGQVRGTMLLGFDLTTARKIASAMVREPLAELTEMGLSALAELGNLIAGCTCIELEQLGFSADISPPTIMIGARSRISTLGIRRVVLPLATQHGHFNLHVAVDIT